jgi:hypothetical protein
MGLFRPVAKPDKPLFISPAEKGVPAPQSLWQSFMTNYQKSIDTTRKIDPFLSIAFVSAAADTG